MAKTKDVKDYEIQKNVPIPRSIGKWKMIHENMDVGDSILLPTHDEARSFRASINQSGGRAKERKTVEGYRVWMVKRTTA